LVVVGGSPTLPISVVSLLLFFGNYFIMKLLFASTLFASCCLRAAEAAAFKGTKTLLGKDIKERYDSGEPWTSLQDGNEFQPAAADLSPLAQEHLRRLTNSNSYMDDSPFNKLFADGGETYYDDYAQAWRYVV
jgi:hypothetical protein